MTPLKPTHEQLQAAAVETLTLAGWRHLHVRRSLGYRKGEGRAHQTVTNVKGWPDLACWKDGTARMIAAEVKVPPDKLRHEQVDVLASLESAGWECYVLTPGSMQAWADVLRCSFTTESEAIHWRQYLPR